MADLVDQLPAEAEVPVDRVDRAAQREIVEPGLLAHLADRGVLGALAVLEVALGKSPVLVAVADEEKERRARRRRRKTTPPAEVSRCARARVIAIASVRAATPPGTPPSSSVGRPSMNCRTTGSVGVLDLVDRADLAHASLVQHRDARADACTRCACRA